MRILKTFLPFSWMYRFVVAVRNKWYDTGLSRIENADVPVIAIGNITTGGTGKTPCAILVIETLLQTGTRVALISRGYGRTSVGMRVVSDGRGVVVDVRDGGDEPVLIAKRFPTVIVVVAERRMDAARKAVALGADCIVADDAFQHRSLARSMDIVMTGDELARNRNPLIPAGDGREPLKALRRASIVISTSHDEQRVRQNLQQICSSPLYFADVVPVDVLNARSNDIQSITTLRDRAVVLLTGIARPERVANAVIAAGGNIVQTHSFRDHHWFTKQEMEIVAGEALQQGAMLLTTEKDWVRLAASTISSVDFANVDLHVLRVAMQMRGPSSEFTSSILMKR